MELVVVLAIIGLLLAILLPALVAARESSRRAACQSNLRNLAVAVASRADARQQYPAAGYFSLADEYHHSWVVELLPWIDARALYDRWNLAQPSTTAHHVALARSTLPVLRCPSGSQAAGGSLSYVVNGGFGWTAPPCGIHALRGIIDLNGDGQCLRRGEGVPPSDFDLQYQTGLFFLDNWPVSTSRHHSAHTVHDGTSQTILLSENVFAGPRAGEPDLVTWALPIPTRVMFFASSYVCADLRCAAGQVDYRRAGSSPEWINRALVDFRGEAPWPSSYHGGGVHAVFADGHARFLSEQIDGAVFCALLSPQGLRIRGPLAQDALAASEF